uniref:Uncharacterized protein n=1 Tax=Rhizophora mucronata TaxID=61149 RepID=A0A2P2PW86_RHIMU
MERIALHLSSIYHSQSDNQTEQLNHCIEGILEMYMLLASSQVVLVVVAN